MGIRHLLLLLIYLDPLTVFCAATGGKKVKTETKRTPKAKEANITAAVPTAAPQKNTTKDYDMCTGYYDVSGQFDREFACNNTVHRYCCGSCYLRFCCQEKEKRVDQSSCKNYNKPDWVKTPPPSPASTGQPFDPSMDQTNTAVYITCGIIAFILVVGVSAKVAYDKATEPPQEMNIHRALADILRQQGPIPISQYDCENFAAMNGSPKDNTPQRTSSKNHYTPVHQSKSNHGLQYGKESIRSSGGHDLHTFISSGFVTLGRGQPKGEKHWPVRSQSHHGTHQQNYNHMVLGSPTRTQNENTRMSGILTSQTEPYDLSSSRSFQSLSHLPPTYEAAVKADLNRYSSLKRLTDKDVDDYYTRKRHLPDLAARSTLPLHVIKMNQEQVLHLRICINLHFVMQWCLFRACIYKSPKPLNISGVDCIFIHSSSSSSSSRASPPSPRWPRPHPSSPRPSRPPGDRGLLESRGPCLRIGSCPHTEAPSKTIASPTGWG
uniref:Shisa family member 6 n=1 Tax=Salmo trutta TaxID=8032 RepID=A0A673XVG8_SALTR